MNTLAGISVAEHTCTGLDCQICVDAERAAAGERLAAYSKKRYPANQTLQQRAQRHAITAPEPTTPLQQTLDAGSDPFTASPAHLADAAAARGFILAGNACFTVKSAKTGTRYTYKVTRGDCSRCKKPVCGCWAHPTYFVALLTGPDNTAGYTYLGMIREDFKATRATGAQQTGKPFLAFAYVWKALSAGVYPAQVEIWHEGRCGRCGRNLTVPESIASGIGPVCAEKGY